MRRAIICTLAGLLLGASAWGQVATRLRTQNLCNPIGTPAEGTVLTWNATAKCWSGAAGRNVKIPTTLPGIPSITLNPTTGAVSAPGGFTSPAGSPGYLVGAEMTAAAAATACGGVPCIYLDSTDHLAKYLVAAGTVGGKMVNPLFTVAGPASARTYTFPDADSTIPRTIASGALALATTEITSAACQTVTTGSVNSAAATGVLTTDVITFTPNASIKAVTGFVPATTGGLTITAYPTAGYVNFDVCNWTSGAVTPGAVTVNWRVTR